MPLDVAATGAPPRPTPTTRELAVVALALAVGIALRWRVVGGVLGFVDVDEATVALQARDYLDGPSVFFPEQPYGGALEVPFVAVLGALGADGALALKLVPITFHLAAAVVVWRVACRVVPSDLGRLAAPVLAWCGPAYLIWHSTKAHAFYGAAMLLAASSLLCALRVAERPDRARVGVFGIVVGLSCWATPILGFVVVPVVVWTIVRRPAVVRMTHWAIAGATVGAAPWLVWNARNGWRSLAQTPEYGRSPADRLDEAVDKLPAVLGLATPFDPSRALVPAAVLVAVLTLVAVVVVATLRTRATAPYLLASVVVGYTSLYPFVNATVFVGPDVRYLSLLLPTLAVAVSSLLPAAGRWCWAALAAVLVVVAGVSWWGVVGMEDPDVDDLFLDMPGLDDVITRLEQLGVERVISDVGGYQIMVATDGRIEGSLFDKPRFPELERIALVEEPSTYVVVVGPRNVAFEDEMRRRGVGYIREDYGVWVLYRLDSWLPPWESGIRLFFGDPIPRPDG